MLNLKLLFQKHAHEIQQFLQKRGHGPDVAADLTQDTFLRILSSAPQKDDNPRAWLHRVARNLSVDLYRRQQIVTIEEMPEEEFYAIADPLSGPERTFGARQDLQILNDALHELPLQTQQAFRLYRLGEMTINDVAEELDISISHCWKLIQRAYLHLRVKLNDAHKQ